MTIKDLISILRKLPKTTQVIYLKNVKGVVSIPENEDKNKYDIVLLKKGE